MVYGCGKWRKGERKRKRKRVEVLKLKEHFQIESLLPVERKKIKRLKLMDRACNRNAMRIMKETKHFYLQSSKEDCKECCKRQNNINDYS